MAKLPKTKYTAVRHEAHYLGNHQFAKCVVHGAITTDKELERVQKAGGVVFDDFIEADDWFYKVNYHAEVEGLVARARGYFSKSVLEGQHIYIPAKEDPSA